MSTPWDSFGDDEAAARRIAEWLVVESVADLEHRSRVGATAYEQLGISAILRRLLIDEAPVLDRARKRLALRRPTFYYTPAKKPDEGTHATYRPAASFGDLSREPTTTKGKIERFLATPAAYHFGEAISVREVIRQFAHTYGGVHLGAPESDPELARVASFQRVVQRVGSVMSLDLMEWTNSLAGLAKVTLAGIRPIAAQLTANPYPSPPGLGRIPTRADFDEFRARRDALGLTTTTDPHP